MLVGCTPLAKVFANSLGDSCEGRGKVDEQWSELGDSCEVRGGVRLMSSGEVYRPGRKEHLGHQQIQQ